MTLFLRDGENRTYVDIECWIKCEDGEEFVEVESGVCIGEYSLLLLKAKKGDRMSLIRDFEMLSELRGWLWERFFMGKKNTSKDFDLVLNELRKILDDIGGRHGLYRVED